ncbi:beta-1,3-galactosyltransferase 5-like isoform X2 [Eriocheir sinensis]|nr:beta-1,3-galactosyltransferase 5-like isoform X2 [Eriocheir sinensis]
MTMTSVAQRKSRVLLADWLGVKTMYMGSRSSPRRVVAAVMVTGVAATLVTVMMMMEPRALSLTRQARHSPRVSPSPFPPPLPEHLNTVDTEAAGGQFDTIPGWPYGMRINEPDTCKDQDVYLLNTITTNPTQVYHRNLIRKMWARKDIEKRLKIRTVFIIAAVRSEVTQRHLQEESDKHRDIIQFDFLETRRNLTVKSLAALHWFRAYCGNASWVLKCDVDAYINFWALLDVLRPAEGSQDAVCGRSKSRSVCRDANTIGCLQRYVVSPEEYPLSIYPPYCSGFAYVLHRRLVDRMLEVDGKRTGPPLFLEDAYVTGLLPRDLNARWLNVRRRIMVVPEYIRPEYHNGTFLFVHDLDGQIGQGATSYVWQKTLQYYGMVP